MTSLPRRLSLEEMLSQAIKKIKHKKISSLEKCPATYDYTVTFDGGKSLHIFKIYATRGIDTIILNFSIKKSKYVAHVENNTLRSAKKIN